MGFKTKLDYSNNRQIKQHLETLTTLSGGTSFGLPFANLTKGPNLATSGETEQYTLIASTFSGNNTTTIYTWYDPRMELGHPYLSALTPTTSAETQTVDPVFAPSASITIDGNVVNTAFTGVTFDLYNIIMTDLGGGDYAGTVEHTFFDVLSADTAEYTGRTIWVDVSGITRTDRLIVTNTPVIGNVLTCIDSEGMASWEPASTPPVSTDVFVTGGTYSSGTVVFTNNTGGTFNVTGFSTGGTGSSSYWSAGTGSDSLSTINGGNLAGGQYALAEGHFNQANGQASHAEGWGNIASGVYSHAEGNANVASGNASHVEGYQNNAGGTGSHAEGNQTKAIGNYSHAEGFATEAIAEISHAEGYETKSMGLFGSHAEGWETIASGTSSHAEGTQSQANGYASHAEGVDTRANGYASHAQGTVTQANGTGSFASGYITQANGNTSFVHGESSVANGDYSIVLGRNITGNTADTTYVDKLNIKQLYTGTSVTNLGINAQGFIIAGTSGGVNVWSAGTGSNSVSTVGGGNIASGNFSVAEGNQTIASGVDSHSEGVFSKALGTASHAEGRDTLAGGYYTHSEGWLTIASGTSSHAGGTSTTALGDSSFVHGSASTAVGDFTVVLGRGITGNTSDTTYVDQFNIKTIGSSPSVNDVRIDATGNLTTNTSDKRFKENISPIEDALTKINALQGVKFQWKDRIAGGDEFKIGFIAQEVEVVEPLLVFTNKNDGYKGIHIDGIIPLLVEAVKELSNGVTEYSNTYLETQTIQAEDNNIELNYNGTFESSVDGGITILRGDEKPTSLLIDSDGNWISNVNILSKGFVIPEYTPISSQDSNGVVGNIVQDDDYLYIKGKNKWKRIKLDDF